MLAPDSEFISYGIIDCMLIPGFTAGFLWIHRDIDIALLGISMRDFDGIIGGTFTTGAIPLEKGTPKKNGVFHPASDTPIATTTSESVQVAGT